MRYHRSIFKPATLIFRGFALLAGLGIGIASFPVEHSHETSGDGSHGFHVHAHEEHAHHSHHSHDHHHGCPEQCSSGESSGESSDHESHVHLLVLDLDLPAELVFDLPRPIWSCIGTVPHAILPADTNNGLRIPGARGPPVG